MQTSEVHYADEKNPEREDCARSAKVEFVFLPDVYIGERERERGSFFKRFRAFFRRRLLLLVLSTLSRHP